MVAPTNLWSLKRSQGTNAARPAPQGADSLNSRRFCITLDAEALQREFEADAVTRSVYALVVEKCPH